MGSCKHQSGHDGLATGTAASGVMQARGTAAAGDCFDRPMGRAAGECNGDVSITGIAESWHAARDRIRAAQAVGRGAERAIAMPRTQQSRRARRDGCIAGMMRKPGAS
jgi:hypothetical protein